MAPGKDVDLSSEREALKAGFLQAAGFGDARREPMGGDASTRQYERLHRGGATYIFMDQPPSVETAPCPPSATPEERAKLGYNALARLAAGRVDAFVATAGWLRAQGLSAPAVLAAEPAKGLAVLEDLGDDLFARLIEAGQDEAPLYDAAISALARMHEAPVTDVLSYDGVTWPFLTYDETALATADRLLVEWLPKLRPQLAFGAEAVAEWEAVWAPIRAYGAANATVFCHRDYHAENLLWLPTRAGPARVGMVDFQDALRAHPSWDLHSLLQDARREVPEALEQAMIARYLAARPGVDAEAFRADYAGLAALNAARILGIFARLIVRDGKPRYAAFIPRMQRMLARNLANPALAGLRGWFVRHASLEGLS
jgi:aminoglycoside/choline kinase family phosphotransferase